MRPRIPFVNMHEEGGSEWKCLYAKFIWEGFNIVWMSPNYWRGAYWRRCRARTGRPAPAPLRGAGRPDRARGWGPGTWSTQPPPHLPGRLAAPPLPSSERILLQTTRPLACPPLPLSRKSRRTSQRFFWGLGSKFSRWQHQMQTRDCASLCLRCLVWFRPNEESALHSATQSTWTASDENLTGVHITLLACQGLRSRDVHPSGCPCLSVCALSLLGFWHLRPEWLGRAFFVLFGGDDLFPQYSL